MVLLGQKPEFTFSFEHGEARHSDSSPLQGGVPVLPLQVILPPNLLNCPLNLLAIAPAPAWPVFFGNLISSP